MINPLESGIYRLKHHNKTGYYLEYSKPNFDVVGKNYGNINKHVSIFWERYSATTNSMGVMLTGAAGSGKTRVAELLGNLALANNMAVVMVTDVKPSIELIPFIDGLYNTLLMFDEFSKNFDMKLQNKMLTMFSSVGRNKKLFVITENAKESISPFIRTRPGRVRYAVDYDRMEEDVITEYCADYHVGDKLINSIMELYQKAPRFTFDHLQAIVSEHMCSPEATMDDLLEILNLDGLVTPPMWFVVRAIRDEDDSVWTSNSSDRAVVRSVLVSTHFRMWVDLTKNVVHDNTADVPRLPPECKNITIRAKDLVNIEDDDTYIYNVDGFTIWLGICE